MALFIKKYKYPNGKIYCSIVDGYRIDNKVKHKVIQKYGYFDDLSKKYIGYKPEIQYMNRKFEINLDKKYDTRENIKKILKY